MKTSIQMMIVGALTVIALTGCGKKDAEVMVSQLPGGSEPFQISQPDMAYEDSYNLAENHTFSQSVCQDLVATSLDVNDATLSVTKWQSQKIKDLCGKSPAHQGETSIKFTCVKVSGSNYTPVAQASTPYRCN